METTYRYTECKYDGFQGKTTYTELSQSEKPTADEIRSHAIKYTYDTEGKLTKVTYPTKKDGVRSLSYHYTSDGWLSVIKADIYKGSDAKEGTVRTYAYDDYGKVTEIKDYRNLLSYGDKAVKKVYTYDSFDRVSKMVYTDMEHPDTVMESYAYSYDKNSNIIEKTQVNNYPQKDEEKVNETKHYTYDTLGRLVKTVTTDHRKDDSKQTMTYTYGKVGNRLAEDKGDTKTTYDYNGLDQVTTSTTWKDGTAQENKKYAYDKNGNEIGQTNGKTGEILYRSYDAENRLTEVSVNKDGKNAIVQQNRYNGDGQRIQRVEGDQTTNYYYQDGVVSYTTDGKGEQTSQDLLGTDGNIIGTQRCTGNDAAYYVYNKDVQGSTTNLLKDDGKADVSYRYEDFGETASVGENTSGNETCYTGGRYDETTGLYYLNARYYNPEDGRFLSEDTYRGEVNEPDTQHLYAYCKDNPINYVDPSGHDAIVLKSYFMTRFIGHMAVLIQDGGNWRYFSWDSGGYKAKDMNAFVNSGKRKSVKGKTVYSSINKRFGRTGKTKRYNEYLYITGNFKNSLSYIQKVKSGKSYRKYKLTGRNCAWMAIEVLRRGHKKGTRQYNALYRYQYTYISYLRQRYINTIVPSHALKKLSNIYGTKIRDIKK